MLNQNSCGALIKHIHDELEKRSNNALRPSGLTMSQVGVLLTLRDVPNHELSLKDLEQILHVAQSTAAGIVFRLEQKGLVDGRVHPEDRRMKIVHLTEQGVACCLEADRNVAQAESELLSSLTEAERSIFQTLLQKVGNSLN